MNAPRSPDSRRALPDAPTAGAGAGAAFHDTVLASRAPGAAAVVEADPARAASLAGSLRSLPIGIQGIWVGLVCIVLLIGSSAALRSLGTSNSGAVPHPGGSATVASSAAAASAPASSSSNGPPPSTATALIIGGGTPGGAVGAFGALAIRDRLATHVRLRKLGPFNDDLNRLVEIEPAAIDRADVRKMIGDAVVFSTAPSTSEGMSPEAERLFNFLTTKAGAAGPDILFDLVTTRGGTRAAAYSDELLKRPEVVAKGTPAFKIANDLRVAPTCKERTALYKRVQEDGDRRSLQFLFAMARCGKGPTDCCQGNEPAYRETVRAINAKK